MKRALVIAVAVLGAAVLIQAQDAETPAPDTPAPRKLDRAKGRQLYDLRYADRRKAVDATTGKDDDVALAAEHLQNVATFAEYPSLALVLCEQAYELGMRHRDGYATAAQAAETLLSDFAELKVEHLPKVVRAYEAQYSSNVDRSTAGERLIELYVDSAKASAAADDFAAAFRTLIKAYPIASSLKSPRKGEVLSVRRYYQTRRDLAKKPSDLKLRMEAIRICIAELDDPATAETLLDGSLDEITKTYVPVAAQDPGEVAEGACLELGNWYLEQTAKASQEGKLICLTRATTYLERYLSLHETKDQPRAKAELLLDKASKQLEGVRTTLAPRTEPRTGPEPKTPEGEWIDLLKFVDLKKHVLHGRWVRQDRGFRSLDVVDKPEKPKSRLLIPVALSGSYEVELAFARTSADYAITFVLPVGQSSVGVSLSYGPKKLSGLAFVDGQMDNETTRPGKLTNGQVHRLRVKVLVKGENAEIAADLDGKKLTRWQGRQSALSPSGGAHSDRHMPNPKCPGLVVRAPTVFGVIRVRMLSGEAKVLGAEAPLTTLPPTKPKVPEETGPDKESHAKPPRPLSGAANEWYGPKALAAVKVTGSRYEVVVLKEGVKGYSDSDYKWVRIPRQFHGWSFTRKGGKTAPEIVVNVVRTGNVAVAVSDPGKEALLKAGWQDAKLSWDCTTQGQENKHFVLYKRFVANTKVTLPHVGFAGTVALIPPAE